MHIYSRVEGHFLRQKGDWPVKIIFCADILLGASCTENVDVRLSNKWKNKRSLIKNIILPAFCTGAVMMAIGCKSGAKNDGGATGATVAPQSTQAAAEPGTMAVTPSVETESPFANSVLFDMDGNGVSESWQLSAGPTSGLCTLVITASEEGNIKYRNTFNILYPGHAIKLEEKDGALYFVFDDRYDRIDVKDGRIVLGDAETRYQYWGGKDWNYDLK